MEYLPFIFFVLFVVYVVGLLVWNIIQNRKADKWLVDTKAEADYQEWLAKIRANMTQAQRDSEDSYINGLRAMPVKESWKPRTGNSLSKDILGFDLLPK